MTYFANAGRSTSGATFVFLLILNCMRKGVISQFAIVEYIAINARIYAAFCPIQLLLIMVFTIDFLTTAIACRTVHTRPTQTRGRW